MELWYSLLWMRETSASVNVVCAGGYQSKHCYLVKVDVAASEVTADAFDAIILSLQPNSNATNQTQR